MFWILFSRRRYLDSMEFVRSCSDKMQISSPPRNVWHGDPPSQATMICLFPWWKICYPSLVPSVRHEASSLPPSLPPKCLTCTCSPKWLAHSYVSTFTTSWNGRRYVAYRNMPSSLLNIVHGHTEDQEHLAFGGLAFFLIEFVWPSHVSDQSRVMKLRKCNAIFHQHVSTKRKKRTAHGILSQMIGLSMEQYIPETTRRPKPTFLSPTVKVCNPHVKDINTRHALGFPFCKQWPGTSNGWTMLKW